MEGKGEELKAKSIEQFLRKVIEKSENSPHPARSPEDIEWLKKVLNEQFKGTDPVINLKKYIAILESKDASDEEIFIAMENLEQYVENIDFALIFCKNNGIDILIKLFNNKQCEIRAFACELIGIAVQNNYATQAIVLEFNKDAFTQLIKLLKQDDDSVKPKALSALSCLCRHEDGDCLEYFMEHCDGGQVLVSALKSNLEKVKLKAVFFLHYISSYKLYSDVLLKNNVLPVIAELLEETSNSTEFIEFLLQVILNYCQHTPEAKAFFAKPNLQQFINQHLQSSNNQELKDYCSELKELS